MLPSSEWREHTWLYFGDGDETPKDSTLSRHSVLDTESRDLPTRGILTTCLRRNDGNSSFPSSRVIAAQVLLTVLDYTEYSEIARNNFGILEDLPHTEEIDSTEDDEEDNPERLVSHLVRYSHDSRDREWDDDLDDIVELWLDREGGGAVFRIGDVVQEDIGIDLISPPEPSDHEWEKYPEYPRIRDIPYCSIVERE